MSPHLAPPLLLILLLPPLYALSCPPGTYTSNNTCLPCPSGTFNPFRSSQGPDLCRPCPPTLISTPGSARCRPCPPNTTPFSDSSRCVVCPAGTAVSYDTRNCHPCYPGQYSDLSANSACKNCPPGTISRAGAKSLSACIACPAGTEARADKCEACKAGFFAPRASAHCIACPAGTFSSGKRSKLCTPCAAGTFSRKRPLPYVGPVRGATKCKKCRPGSVARGNGNSFCQPLRAPCPFNARKMKDGACITCEKNEYVDVRTNTCAKCTDGLVSMGGGVTKCEKCSTGMVKLEFVTKGKVCDCDVGTVLQRGKCVKCPSGSSRKPGDVGGCKKCAKGSFERDGKCVECAVDTYQPAEGAKSCLPCVGNQVVGSTVDTPAHELQGASRCVRCKKGWYFSDREYPGSCVSGRTNCADGYTRRMIREGNREEFGGCRRNVCPKGTFREGEFGACISCDRGTYYNKKERRCDFCERDEVSEGGLVEKCTKCTGGLVPDAADGGSCTCQATFEDRGNPFEPTKIARGYNKSGVCELCAKGTFNEDDSNRCSPCPMGTFADRRGMDKCKTCPPNTFSRGGASKCETCAKGSVTYGFGDPKCLILS